VGDQGVEFATPPVLGDEDLDADHDEDVPLQFRRVDNILGPTSPQGWALRVLSQELHIINSDELKSFAEAEADPSWRRAMLEEMKATEDNGTWYLTSLPPEHCAIELKWVFKVKQDEHD
jgi:hypothetical protein